MCVERVTRNEESINAYRVLTEKSEGNRQLGRTRRGLEGNIRNDLINFIWESMDSV